MTKAYTEAELFEWVSANCYGVGDCPRTSDSVVSTDILCDRFRGMQLVPADMVGKLQIGEFTLSFDPEGGFWIYHISGEGGHFRSEHLAYTIRKFYSENF